MKQVWVNDCGHMMPNTGHVIDLTFDLKLKVN